MEQLHKLLFYVPSISGGGAARVVTNLANKFVDQSFEVILITSMERTHTDYIIDDRIKYICLLKEIDKRKNFILKNICFIYRLNKILKIEKPDIAISFMAEPNFRLLMCSTKIKKIISIRNDPNEEYRGWRGAITKCLFRRANGIVCQTDDVLKWLKPNIRTRSKVIMNQVDSIFYSTVHKSDDYYVATGRLVPQKNYDMLINSFHTFLKKYPNEKLKIFGEGPLYNQLQKTINNLGRSNNITLEGKSTNIPLVLAHAKAFILSSDYEGMPNGLLEAMAVGLPCISTDCPCGGPKMIIKHNENGLLIPVGGIDDLIKALNKIEEDKEFASKIGQNARAYAHRNNNPEMIFQKWKIFIEFILKEK